MSDSRPRGAGPSTWRLCLAVVVALAATLPARAVVDGALISNADRRFDAVGLFITTDPSGPCAGWISGSCTLIGPNTVLFARHSLNITSSQPLPDPSVRRYRVRFRRALSGISENSLVVGGVTCHGVYQEIDVAQLMDAPIPGGDQALGILATPPVGIAPIGVELNAPPQSATPIILAGWGYSGECYQTGPAWCLRSVRGVCPNNWAVSDTFAFSNCSLGSVLPCLVCPLTTQTPVVANLHDSGGPIFIEVPSTDPTDPTPELRLVGSVSSPTTCMRPSSWNHTGGQPQFVQAAPTSHLKKGDFDGDGHTTTNDIFLFLDAFFAGRLDADTNGNGTLELQDVFTFLNEWFAGL